MLNFPSSPTLNEEYIYGNRTWVWNGVGWSLKAVVNYGSTDNVAEGSTNRYFTVDRARSAISVAGGLAYNSSTGVITGPDLTGYLTGAAAASMFQQLDGDLSAIAGLSGASGILKKTAANTWALDTSVYLTGITSSQVTAALGFSPEDAANRNANGGYAGLDSNGLIPSSLLPGYVDDVIEVANYAALPATGEAGKIYILATPYTSDGITSSQFRWSGSAYAPIISSPGSTDAVTEGSVNLYFTTARARASISGTGGISYNPSTGVMTGPDLSGYQTTAAASSTYLPLAGGIVTGATTFKNGNAIAAKIGVTGLFSIGGEAGSADSLLTVTNGGAVGLEFSPTAISGRNRILSYNRVATAFVPLNYAASEHNWDVSGTVHLSLTSAGLTLNAGTANGLAYLNGSKVLTTGSALTFDGSNLATTGNITAYYSDDRLKTKLGGIENALDKVDQLSGFYYEANETAQALGYKPKREVGVSAQQVQAVMPEVVSPAPIDQQYLTVDYERLVPLLIEAIKELRAEVR